MKLVLKTENLAQLVYFIRGEKVMLDADLARLYGVSTKALNQALRRNRERFPDDFVFQLTAEEFAFLRSPIVISNAEEPYSQRLRPNWSQFVTSSGKHRGARYRPYAFTEQGVAMLSSVLRSRRAVEVNIAIMRTFVQLRRLMDTNRDLARKIEALEKKYDEQYNVRGRRWMDCIGPLVRRPSVSGERESIRRSLRGHKRADHSADSSEKTDRLSSLISSSDLRLLGTPPLRTRPISDHR